MAKLEELTPGTSVKGIFPDRLVTIIAAKWIGATAIELTHKDASGNLGSDAVMYVTLIMAWFLEKRPAATRAVSVLGALGSRTPCRLLH